MPEYETLFLVAYEDGYLSDIQAAFTDEALAQVHAEDTGGTVVPIRVFSRAPTRTVRYTYVTQLERTSGIVKRRDFHETPEWEYENPIELDGKETRTIGPGGLRGSTIVTYGYDKNTASAAHEQAIKDNKGIDL